MPTTAREFIQHIRTKPNYRKQRIAALEKIIKANPGLLDGKCERRPISR